MNNKAGFIQHFSPALFHSWIHFMDTIFQLYPLSIPVHSPLTSCSLSMWDRHVSRSLSPGTTMSPRGMAARRQGRQEDETCYILAHLRVTGCLETLDPTCPMSEGNPRTAAGMQHNKFVRVHLVMAEHCCTENTPTSNQKV